MVYYSNRSKAARIEAALIREGLRGAVDAVEPNPATPGEVVLWLGGMGHPVYSVREALTVVRQALADEDAEDADL